MLKALVFVLSAVVVSGCYSHTSIKPTELPKLNGAAVVDLGQQGNTHVVGVTVAHVEAPDGHLEEISGTFDVVVTTSSGNEVDFEHPVESSVREAALTVAGGNRGQTEFQLNDIRDVSIEKWSAWNAVWIAIVVPVGIIGGSGLIFLAIQ